VNRFTQRVGCYRAHELAHARSEVPSAEIIQPGFAIPFFAGEFVGGAEAASDLFAEGEVVERVKDRLVHGGHEASGAKWSLWTKYGTLWRSCIRRASFR